MNIEFAEQLAKWGPAADVSRAVSLTEAEAYCQTLAREHYENFSVVSWLLPRGLHQHFYNIYAYCRWSDDLADEVDGTEASLSLLSWWRECLNQCYAGHSVHPVFVALYETLTRYEIPQEPFTDLLSAFEQDQQVTEYETKAEILDYCQRSANPVGRLVLRLCECSSEQNISWSDSLCTGLQLANFWQDVQRDADRGRTYLPREDCERFGYTRSMLSARQTNPEFLALMKYEVEEARAFLLAGSPLVEQMPGRMQVDIEMFMRGGLRILERIAAMGFRVWEHRPVISKTDQLLLLQSCMLRMLWRTRFGMRTSQRNQSQPVRSSSHPVGSTIEERERS